MEQLPTPRAYEQGHDFIYRLTAMDPEPTETRYYKSPYQARRWRDRLREAGFEAVTARVPADAFQPLSDTDLDALAKAEIAGR